jgi:hypothetical protein
VCVCECVCVCVSVCVCVKERERERERESKAIVEQLCRKNDAFHTDKETDSEKGKIDKETHMH